MKKSVVLMLLSLVSLMNAADADNIVIKKQAGKFDSYVINTNVGKSKFEAINHYWGNTYAYTPKGQKIYLTDPICYNLRHPKETRYLTHKDLWSQIQATIQEKGQVLILNQQIPGSPFKQTVRIKMIPGKNQLMVTNTVKNLTDKKAFMNSDTRCIWQSNLRFLEPTIDGKKLTKDKFQKIKDWKIMSVYNTNTKVTYGAILVSGNSVAFFDLSPKDKSVNSYWGRGTGFYKPQETRVQRYILMWGDNDITDEINAVGAKAAQGALDKDF